MALVKIKPYIVDATGNYTFNGVNATGNLSSLNANLGNAAVANYFIGSGANLTNIPAANVSGQVANALVSGTVYTNAQPNITSVGSLSGLTVSNATGVVDFTTTANVTLGAVANLHISGGTANYVLQTDGSGNLSWAAQTGGGGGTPGGTNTQVQFNDAGAFGANSAFTFDKTTGTLASTIFSGAGNALSNIQGANVSGAVTYATTANAVAGANVSGQVGNALIAGTVYTNAQPNITSVGTLTSLDITGNLSAGNITTGGSSGNITGANVISANFFQGNGSSLTNLAGANVIGQVGNALVSGTVYTNAQPNITSVGSLTSLSVAGTGSFGGNVAMGNFWVTGLNAPVNDTDAATKKYVDDVVQGLNIHDSVVAATPTTLATITSGTITYNNGSSGIGANLTTTGSFNLIDGVNVQTTGTRILVKNEANTVHNGIYIWSNATVITRATDFNTVPEVEAGDFVFVSGGTLYNDTGWVQTSSPTTIGGATDFINFTQFSGAGTYTAGTGLTLLGSQFSIAFTTVSPASYGNGDRIASFTVNGQGQLTAASDVVIAANAANLTGTSLASSIIASNLTSVGNLTGLTVSNATGVVNFTNTANVSLGAVANLKITGGTSDYVLKTDGAGNLSWTAQTGGGGGGGASISNGTSNVNIATSGGDVTTSVNGNANIVVVTGTGANINGTLNTTGNVAFSGANVSLGSVGNLKITGGTSDYILRTDGAGNLSWVAQSGGGGGGGSSISNGTSNVNIATADGNVTIAAAGNTTMTITGTGANINGTLNTTGNVALSGANVSLGAIGNLKITGGTSGYVIQTDGTGNLSWTAQSGGGGGTIASTIQEFVATAAQTTFIISGGYTVGSLLVFVNGIGLNSGDYTATSGTNIVLSEARNAGDIVRVIYNLSTPSLVVDAAKNFAVAMSVALGM